MARQPHQWQQFFRNLVETAQDLIWRVDREGRITYLNGAWEELLGYKREEMLSLHFSDFQSPGQTERDMEALARVLDGEILEGYEICLRDRNGRRLYLSFNAKTVRDDEDRVIGAQGTARDITAPRETELALRESERQFRALVNGMAEGVALHEMVYDEAGAPVNYRLLAANPGFERILGLSREQVLGQLATAAYQVEEAPYLEEYARVVATGTPAQFDTFFAPMGRHFSISVAPWGDDGFATIFTDVTERKRDKESLERALHDLEESTRALRASQEAGHLGTYELDIVGNHWVSSPILDTIFGIDDGYERTVEGWLRLVHPDWREEMDRYFAEKVVAERGEFNKEYVIVRQSDGEGRWVHGLGKLTLDAQGRPVTMFGTIADVTDRHLANEERIGLERQMQQAQKLESLGMLAGGIAHDFNNLLMAILGNADLALSELSPLAPARESVKAIENAARRAADLANQMLAYSGKGSFAIEQFSLNELVEEMTHLLEASISKKIALRFDLERELPQLRGDVTQIRQVIMNLITNASEAIADDDGAATIRTGVCECDSDFRDAGDMVLGGEPEDVAGLLSPCVFVEVADTGCGMDPEELTRIFDPFFTTKFTGRGLGLAAVAGIVRAHGGLIRTKTRKGVGTTFTVLLPAVAPAQDASEKSTPPREEWRAEGVVMIADDEEKVRAVNRRMLERLGFEVVEASDGSDALEQFRQTPDRFACVILDLTMPRMDGGETLTEMRRIRPEVPVVITSGYSEQEVCDRFVGQRVEGFLHKPYTMDDLEASLQEVLRS